MADISQYLAELKKQKNQLAANLAEMGVESSAAEKLNTLVPKVLDIKQGSDFAVEGYYKDGYFYEDEECTIEIEPDYSKIYTDKNSNQKYVCDGLNCLQIMRTNEHVQKFKTIGNTPINFMGDDYLYYVNLDDYTKENNALDINTGVAVNFPAISSKWANPSKYNFRQQPNRLNGKLVIPPGVNNYYTNSGTYCLPMAREALICTDNLIWQSIPFESSCTVDGLGSDDDSYDTTRQGDIGTMMYTDKYYMLVRSSRTGSYYPLSEPTAIEAFDENYVRTVSTDPVNKVHPNVGTCVFNGVHAINFGWGMVGSGTYITDNYKCFAIDNNMIMTAISDRAGIGSVAGLFKKNSAAVFLGGYNPPRVGSSFASNYITSGIMIDKNLQLITLSSSLKANQTPKSYGNTKFGESMLIQCDDGNSMLGINKQGNTMYPDEFKIDINGIITLPGEEYSDCTDDPIIPHTWGVDIPFIYGEHKGKIIGSYKNSTGENIIAELKYRHDVTINERN